MGLLNMGRCHYGCGYQGISRVDRGFTLVIIRHSMEKTFPVDPLALSLNPTTLNIKSCSGLKFLFDYPYVAVYIP